MPFEHAGSQYFSVRAAGRPGTVAMSKAGFRELHAHVEQAATATKGSDRALRRGGAAAVTGQSSPGGARAQWLVAGASTSVIISKAFKELLYTAIPPEGAAQQSHREQRRATAVTERNTDSDRSIGGLSVCLRLSICIYMRLHLSICVYLCLSIHLRLSISDLQIASVYLSASIIYLSIYLCASVYRTHLRLSATASVSIWPGLSVGRSTCLSVGR